MLHFQEMIIELSEFWAEQGCVIHQGYDLEVGAGTFNPATFLRSLGPEPYAAVYVEPSRRPKDGRYGDNPNRVQHYHQMQVIYKPSPSDILDLYIQSLDRIGLKLSEHDIRFVHDDWENPTIGASGLGWEVWLDGMEVSQFTYFQTVGGLPVKPVSGEITYGLERLAMYLQGVDSMFDIKWNDKITYGDIFKRSEWEWSHYNFHEASTKMWLQHFDDYEKEALSLIAKSLPLPAYDFVMKASHCFNLLDARGVISVTMRTGYIARIRALAKEVALSFIKSRDIQEFPLLKHSTPRFQEVSLPPLKETFDSKEKEDFLLEIGSEELPATFIPIGISGLERAIKKLLQELHVNYDTVACYGSPRRLACHIVGLAGGTMSEKIERKGPALDSAFNNTGAPTPAGEGFFRSIGVDVKHVSDLEKQGVEIRDIKGTKYLFAVIHKPSLSTRHLLAAHLPSLILGLDFPKKMRWEDLDIEFARPIRWIVSLYGNEVIPFAVGNVIAANSSFGHRQLANRAIVLSHPKEYLEKLRQHHVIVDVAERKKMILDGLKAIETKTQTHALSLDEVLSQVLYLVEKPYPDTCHFDPSYLRAPKEVLISEMVEHQKYFPLAKGDGTLAPLFVIVANNVPQEKIRHGNERALAPRLADGLFLFQEDQKVPLEKYNEKLKTVTFQKELGSVYQKMERLVFNVEILHRELRLGSLEKAKRAAFLSKADLVTTLVGEFPELQGTIGHLYALNSGEDPEVASAIEEHWMPRSEKGSLPKTDAGRLLSLADKIDNFLSCFLLGFIPTSSSDPYALRRQALGMIKIILEAKLTMPLKKVLQESATRFNVPGDKEAAIDGILQFLATRLRTVFLDHGYEKDEIEAVLALPLTDIYEISRRLSALHALRKEKADDFKKLLTVHTRTRKILESDTNKATVDASLFVDPSEKNLHAAISSAERDIDLAIKKGDEKQAFFLFSSLHGPLGELFDKVKIIDDDVKVKNNRLALLSSLLKLSLRLADLSKIQEKS